ncbi:UNVERIFIED_CONTAM: hypothetical protein Slati_2204700 [Sesamum latifolium]|uniref:Uncharacterized protein n=1 Tax=Sesamum latifolium TaxID=2727402 RepID=A0AAW2WT44_9LAMI
MITCSLYAPLLLNVCMLSGGRYSFTGRTSWTSVIQWTSVRWRGKHVVNASIKALLAALVYHLWQERNCRIFQHITRPPIDIARIVVSDIRELITCKQLPRVVSTRGLYRLWRIPWHVEGEANIRALLLYFVPLSLLMKFTITEKKQIAGLRTYLGMILL